MTIRTQLKAGEWLSNHSEALKVRSTLKAGGSNLNHNEALRVRSAMKAGRLATNHNEPLRAAERQAVSMRRELVTSTRKEDRLELLVVRAGLRAGRRARARRRN